MHSIGWQRLNQRQIPVGKTFIKTTSVLSTPVCDLQCKRTGLKKDE